MKKLFHTSFLVIMAAHIAAFTAVGIATGSWRWLLIFVAGAALIEAAVQLIRRRRARSASGGAAQDAARPQAEESGRPSAEKLSAVGEKNYSERDGTLRRRGSPAERDGGLLRQEMGVSDEMRPPSPANSVGAR